MEDILLLIIWLDKMKLFAFSLNAALGNSVGIYHRPRVSKERSGLNTVKVLKFGTPQTICIIVLKYKKFDVT